MDGFIKLRKKGFDGIVVTHGTYTLEETAYFLYITIRPGVPVVITGVQRNPSLISPDGPLNLIESILVAAHDCSKGLGVLVVFASEIIAAREATKFYRARTDAFKSLESGPIGAVNDGRVVYLKNLLSEIHII